MRTQRETEAEHARYDALLDELRTARTELAAAEDALAEALFRSGDCAVRAARGLPS